MFEFERQRVPITRIRIHRVLGDPNANVALSFPPEGGGVRILHGRNGSGKTSILDLINRAFSDGPFDARHLWASGGEIEFALEELSQTHLWAELRRRLGALGDGRWSLETVFRR